MTPIFLPEIRRTGWVAASGSIIAAIASHRWERRVAARLTQAEVAERIGSSEPRIARAEAGRRNVSFDLLLRAMVATGATNNDIGKALASKKPVKTLVTRQKSKVA